jgi:hypothetical protein
MKDLIKFKKQIFDYTKVILDKYHIIFVINNKNLVSKKKYHYHNRIGYALEIHKNRRSIKKRYKYYHYYFVNDILKYRK